MLDLLTLCFWLDAGLDHFHDFDAGLVQEPSFANLAADALSKNYVGNDVGDECPEARVL
jgi:hypothetical protein